MNRLILNMPPSVNHMYVNAYTKRKTMRVLSTIAKDWKIECVEKTGVWMQNNAWETATGKVILNLYYYFPDQRKRDTHNTLKLMLDGLEDAGLYENDYYALPRVINFWIDKKNPRVEIEVLQMH
jgi:crossover junction endodeoxyribonuclease RusA